MKNAKISNNKLTIYKLHRGLTENDIRIRNDIECEKISEDMDLFWGKSYPNAPKFVSSFFHKTAEEFGLYSASVKMLLIVRNVGEKKSCYAIAFGNGRHLLDQDNIERRFGLITALNVIDSENIKNFSKTKLEANPKKSKEQLSYRSNFTDFGIDIAQDLINGVSGGVKEGLKELLGETVYGTDSLSFTARCDMGNVRNVLAEVD